MAISDLAVINGDYLNRKLNGNGFDLTKVKSRLSRNVPDELKIRVTEIAMNRRINDLNEKADMISEAMSAYGFSEIGTGTNRIAFLKDGYVYKVALDKRGFIDNVSEYKRSIEFPKYFFKVYEVLYVTKTQTFRGVPHTTTVSPIMTCEYCELLSEQTFSERKTEIKAILDELSRHYIIDDVGLTNKNYCNWGLRQVTTKDGEHKELVIIDNAYFYPIRDNYQMLRCTCGGTIGLNSTYTGYLCKNSACGMTYTVAEILNKSRYDYDSGDTELVKIIGDDNNSNEYVKVTGNDVGDLENIVLGENEATEVINTYKAANVEPVGPNAAKDVKEYYSSSDDSPEENDNRYRKINASDIRRAVVK